MCLVIVNCVYHVTTPGGTVTVSPSDALAIAAATFASWASMAGHVAAYTNEGSITDTSMIPKLTEPLFHMESILRRAVGEYLIVLFRTPVGLLVECCLDWVRNPREQKTSRPDLSIVEAACAKIAGALSRKI